MQADLRDFLNQIAEELNIPQSKRNESVERWKFAFEERDIYNTHQLQRLLEKGGRLPFVIDDKTARKIHSALNIQKPKPTPEETKPGNVAAEESDLDIDTIASKLSRLKTEATEEDRKKLGGESTEPPPRNKYSPVITPGEEIIDDETDSYYVPGVGYVYSQEDLEAARDKHD